MKKNILLMSLLFAFLITLTFCSSEKKADAPETVPAEEIQQEAEVVEEAPADVDASGEDDG